MKKFNKTPLTLAMGTTAVISGFSANANAEINPFALSELSSGYMVAEASNKTGHGACGGNVADANGNKITGAKKEAGADKAPKTKKAEGSCGEGMCGGMMDGGKMKKGMEGMCGEMMKGKEGMCGMMGGMKGMGHGDKSEEGSCGAMMKGDEAKKGGEGSCGSMMKGGEGSCGSKVDADKAAGE
ncbi:MAG: hypothetical protein PHH11_05135 [Methylomonas sp.]|nr:hypothetical protein [Methylomonas sp.]